MSEVNYEKNAARMLRAAEHYEENTVSQPGRNLKNNTQDQGRLQKTGLNRCRSNLIPYLAGGEESMKGMR